MCWVNEEINIIKLTILMMSCGEDVISASKYKCIHIFLIIHRSMYIHCIYHQPVHSNKGVDVVGRMTLTGLLFLFTTGSHYRDPFQEQLSLRAGARLTVTPSMCSCGVSSFFFFWIFSSVVYRTKNDGIRCIMNSENNQNVIANLITDQSISEKILLFLLLLFDFYVCFFFFSVSS